MSILTLTNKGQTPIRRICENDTISILGIVCSLLLIKTVESSF